jgi:hypothetical protein
VCDGHLAEEELDQPLPWHWRHISQNFQEGVSIGISRATFDGVINWRGHAARAKPLSTTSRRLCSAASIAGTHHTWTVQHSRIVGYYMPIWEVW